MSRQKDSGGFAAMLLAIVILVVLVWVNLKVSTLIYRYSRNVVLAAAYFSANCFVLFYSVFAEVDFITTFGIDPLWLVGIYSVLAGGLTVALYKRNQGAIDSLIQAEREQERIAAEQASRRSSSGGVLQKLLLSGGAMYLGYRLGRSTEL